MTYDYRAARESILGSDIPGPLKLVALVLVEYMPNCQPSVSTLALRCSVERKTAIRAIAKLERMGVIAVHRRIGERSSYSLQPVSLWQTGTKTGPVPISGTGTNETPVPNWDGTGTNGGMGPVPNWDGTGTKLGPEAGRSRSESGKAGEERAREAEALGEPQKPERPPSSPVAVADSEVRLKPSPGVGKTYSMPDIDPPQAYLDEALMAGVGRVQATATWNHYRGAGLPDRGVERLHPWLVQRAKERSAQVAQLPRGSPAPTPSEGPQGWQPDVRHRTFVERKCPSWMSVDREQNVFRRSPRFKACATHAEADAAFFEHLKEAAKGSTGTEGRP